MTTLIMPPRLQWEVGQAQRSDSDHSDSVTETASGGAAVITILYTAQELQVPS